MHALTFFVVRNTIPIVILVQVVRDAIAIIIVVEMIRNAIAIRVNCVRISE